MTSETPTTTPMKNIGRRGAELSGECTRTTNGYGWQFNVIDDHCKKFVDLVKSADKPILDTGAAYGYSTEYILNNTPSTVKVIANELDGKQLDSLPEKVTPEQRGRLTIMPGNALELEFPEGSLAGIQALRWFHFLHPDQIRTAFQRFSKFLAPGGKLCITVGTPHLAESVDSGFFELYTERKTAGDEWPGYMSKENRFWPDGVAIDHGYFFDPEVLKREAEAVGLKAIHCEYIPRDFAYTNGQENIGFIAEKVS